MLRHLDFKLDGSDREEPGAEGGKVMPGAGASSSDLAPLSHLYPKPCQGYEMQIFWDYQSSFSY